MNKYRFSFELSAAWNEELTEYRVSTLKPLFLNISLLNETGTQVFDHPSFQIEASLSYEDGDEITPLKSESLLSDYLSMMINGKAALKTRIGILSSQHQGRRFRIRIKAVDEPIPLIYTGPIRTVTKLFRKRGNSRDEELEQMRDELKRQRGQLDELNTSFAVVHDEIRALYNLFKT